MAKEPAQKAGSTPPGDKRRKKKDRRAEGRRVSQRRMAGIGEVIPERRMGPRRAGERRGPIDRRD